MTQSTKHLFCSGLTPIPIALSNCTINKGKKQGLECKLKKKKKWQELPFSKITKIQDQILNTND